MADYSSNVEITYSDELESCTVRFRCFDTPNEVTVYGCAMPDYRVEELLLGVRRRCLELHQLWSFSAIDSDISRINASRETGGEGVEVAECTADLLSAMKEFHELEPAFDFTAGAVSYLWKHAREVPSDGQLAEALTHVGAEKVIIDGRRVFKADPFVQVDVGGAAKGYAADEIAVKLREAGVANADIDLGGNLFMLGEHPSGRPWRVSIQDPRYASPANAHAGLEKPPQAELPILEVTDQAVVTSGSYERFAEIDGVRYQHIVDLRTGQPSNSDVVSATVVSSSALRADMLATTALIVDPVDLQARHPGERFVIVV